MPWKIALVAESWERPLAWAALEVVRVDCGTGFFEGIAAMRGYGPPWQHYGPATPIFVLNTNVFEEPTPPAASDYVILGSGFLGLRLVVESRPPRGAKLVIY